MPKIKRNPLLNKIEAHYERLLHRERLFVLQLGLDLATIALSDRFGFGRDRAEAFGKAYEEVLKEYCEMVNDETDKDMTYTKEKVDRRLKEIFREKFVPWQERY